MITVQVGGIDFPSFNSTDDIAVDIYLSGCNRVPKCPGCHNPELWDFNYGKKMKIMEVIQHLKDDCKEADSIAIMGGEPIHQENLPYLLSALKEEFPDKDLWLYTSYELDDLDTEIYKYVDYIKTGVYDESRKSDGRLGSYNQIIWKVTRQERGGRLIGINIHIYYADENLFCLEEFQR